MRRRPLHRALRRHVHPGHPGVGSRARPFLLALASVAWLVVVTSCSTSSSSDANACVVEGKECHLDTECCTSFCELQGEKAYCQQDRGQNPGCSDERGACTQNRHCCSGFCQDGTCVGNGSTCGRAGSACSESATCCSGYCIQNTCQPPPRDNTGGDCHGDGAPCAQPDDCCTGFCIPDATGGSVCVSQVAGGGGGGGGSNCGASGAYCRRGTDCCTGICTSTSSSGICR